MPQKDYLYISYTFCLLYMVAIGMAETILMYLRTNTSVLDTIQWDFRGKEYSKIENASKS